MSNSILTIKNNIVEIHFEYFDVDKELEIWIENTSTDRSLNAYLSPNQINDLIIHLADKLKEIGEPVLLLQK